MKVFVQGSLAISLLGVMRLRLSAGLLALALALSGCIQPVDPMLSGDTESNGDDGDPIELTAELTMLFMDDFDNNRAERQYFVEDKQNNKKYKLKFKDTPPGHLRSGTQVIIRGKAKGKEIFLAADGIESPDDSNAPVTAAVAGEQRTIVMAANFHDSQLGCSVDSIRDLMFTDAGNQSVDDYYQETSHGRIWLSGEVRGAYTIDNPGSCGAPFSAYTDPIDAAAEADGVDLTLFDRRVYVMPYTGCGYAGVGSVGNTPSQALIFTCGIPDVYAHELGHNFGMYHASTPNSEYGDGTGIMGAGNVGLRHVNSAHQDEMGWRSPAMNTLIAESGIYDIAPQALDEAQSLAPQILRIAKPDTGEYYYVAYRRPLGFDSNLQWWHHDIVTVHRYQGGGGPPTNTFLVSELAVGQSFTDAVNDITVSHVTQTPDYATVQIAINGGIACTPGTPSVSLAPASQDGEPGTTLSYSVSVTNQDSANCAASSFTLDSAVPTGWTGNVSPSSLSLSPGETGAATFLVASAATATASTYGVSVTAMDSSEAVHTATDNASYTVITACTPAAPNLSISPASQNADAGTALEYTVSLVNNDSAACSASTFDLNIALAPAGWGASLADQNLILAPGAAGTTSLSVASSETADPGSYSVQVAATDSQDTVHAASASTTYVVNESAPPAGDVQPPTTPSGLAANANSRRVNLSWSASSDNVAVSGYRVYRDGTLIATTAETSYMDRNGVAGVTYAYTVAAYDAAGNVSAPSAPVMAAKRERGGKGKRPK